ncbi:MAG: hypothetical protein J5847_02780 [Clostridia bacterium]|nr:hypothetical protein [Clostridia bacterium]
MAKHSWDGKRQPQRSISMTVVAFTEPNQGRFPKKGNRIGRFQRTWLPLQSQTKVTSRKMAATLVDFKQSGCLFYVWGASQAKNSQPHLEFLKNAIASRERAKPKAKVNVFFFFA